MLFNMTVGGLPCWFKVGVITLMTWGVYLISTHHDNLLSGVLALLSLVLKILLAILLGSIIGLIYKRSKQRQKE